LAVGPKISAGARNVKDGDQKKPATAALDDVTQNAPVAVSRSKDAGLVANGAIRNGSALVRWLAGSAKSGVLHEDAAFTSTANAKPPSTVVVSLAGPGAGHCANVADKNGAHGLRSARLPASAGTTNCADATNHVPP